MINAVIVEDEMLVRLGTKLCLEGYQGAIRVVEAFETGEAALEYFQSHTADVLITDIKLNGMSGLELIREVKHDHMQMRTIVLSCYEDFSYAREAMELGVDKYLLKHELTGDELPKLVAGLCREARFARKAGSREERSVPRQVPGLEISAYRLGYLVLRGEKDARNSGPEQLDMNILAEIIQRLLNVGSLGECFLRHDKEVFLVFQMETGVTREEFQEKLRKFFERLSRNISNYFNKNTYLFLSDFFESLNQVTTAFARMKQMSAFAFYYETSRLFSEGMLRSPSGICPKLRVETEGAFSEKWFGDCEKQIRNFFFEAGKNLTDVAQVKAEVVKYFYAMEEYLAGYREEERRTGPERDYTSIDAFDSAARLEEWLLELLEEAKEKLPGSDEQLYRIEEYIQAHYQEELSLERISDAFHMSMAYFCQYFKKKKGVSFVSYVNGLRIQKAKELLRDPKLSTEQVSGAVGISNTNYFIRLFKKTTGQTVGTYRKNLKL
ncbi:MAG: response regulator [Candidatus Limivivens sp.]|nr:response regulator [Candidatus Limivivens sp.]